jgi:polysaccharide export outer membrane protein
MILFTKPCFIMNTLSVRLSKKSLFAYCILITTLLVGCVPLKSTIYVQDGKTHPAYSKTTFKTSTYTYVIAKRDILQIDLGSTSPEKLNEVVNKSSNAVATQVQNPLAQGYIVDDKGQVLLPFIGYITLEGLTLTEAQAIIHQRLSEYIGDAFVKVRLLSFIVTVLGEVGQPGRLMINTAQVNILEALALAGNLPITANHKKIQVIRTLNGVVTTHYVDVTSADIYNSEVFYLQPNDMIYVEPVKAKVTQNNLAVVGVATTVLNTLFIITNIIIVLATRR